MFCLCDQSSPPPQSQLASTRLYSIYSTPLYSPSPIITPAWSGLVWSSHTILTGSSMYVHSCPIIGWLLQSTQFVWIDVNTSHLLHVAHLLICCIPTPQTVGVSKCKCIGHWGNRNAQHCCKLLPFLSLDGSDSPPPALWAGNAAGACC